VDHLKVAVVTRSFSYLSFWAALDRGFYVAQSLDVEIPIYESVAQITQGLKHQDVQLAVTSPELVFYEAVRGTDLRAIAGVTNRPPHYLMARQHYRRIEDLRGANIGVTSLENGLAALTVEVLARHGLAFPDDYRISAVGPDPSRDAFLRAETLDAAFQAPPFNYIEEDDGFALLARASDYVGDFQVGAVVVDLAWASHNRDAVRRFLIASIQGAQWLFANEEAAIELAAEQIQLSPGHARRAWREYTGTGVFSPDLHLSREGFATALEFFHDKWPASTDHRLPVDRYLDGSFLNDAYRMLGLTSVPLD
jgi:ABC-type nitrate/sulfonate/bicarbonate transport system substrate-binding protein